MHSKSMPCSDFTSQLSYCTVNTHLLNVRERLTFAKILLSHILPCTYKEKMCCASVGKTFAQCETFGDLNL